MVDSRLRIAWFSDLSKGRHESISTYVSRLLLPELSKIHSIEVFSDAVSREEFQLPHHHYLTAYQRHRSKPFDLFFYQVEDGFASRFIRGHIGLVPGVVWVHDLFCRDLGPEACHTSPWEHSIRQFYDSQLPFADRSVAPHQLWPRLFREVSLCPVVLFSSRWAHQEFSRMTSNRLEAEEGGHSAEVLEIPVETTHGGQRRKHGEIFTVACALVTGIEGRMHKVLPALKALPVPWKLIWMVDDNDSGAAQALAAEFGLSSDSYEVVASASPTLWSSIVQGADCALHLHTSVFGHLAPYVQISLTYGCPVIAMQSGQGEDIPDSVACKVIPGTHESAQLMEIFSAFRNPNSADFGLQGREYALRQFEPGRIAHELSRKFQVWAPQVSYVMHRWDLLRTKAQHVLLEEVRTLVTGSVVHGVNPFEQVVSPAIRDLGW
jgi:hypothetical protein